MMSNNNKNNNNCYLQPNITVFPRDLDYIYAPRDSVVLLSQLLHTYLIRHSNPFSAHPRFEHSFCLLVVFAIMDNLRLDFQKKGIPDINLVIKTIYLSKICGICSRDRSHSAEMIMLTNSNCYSTLIRQVQLLETHQAQYRGKSFKLFRQSKLHIYRVRE